MTKPGRPSSKETIIKAAIDVLAEVGPGHLTLEAVAQRAGVSKGGLLYNFPSKTALLAAMIEHHLQDASALFDELESSDPPTMRKAIRIQFERRMSWLCDAATNRTGHSMLAAIAEQPELLEPVRRLHAMLWKKVKTWAKDPYGNWASWLASEGLLFSALLSLSPLSPEEHRLLIERLERDVARIEEADFSD